MAAHIRGNTKGMSKMALILMKIFFQKLRFLVCVALDQDAVISLTLLLPSGIRHGECGAVG